jgi:hypothetical protein
MKPFTGSGTMRCIAHLFSGCLLHQKQDLLAFGSIIQNLICLLSPDHETFYRLRHDALHRTYFWLFTSPKARFTCFWFDHSELNLSALAQS